MSKTVLADVNGFTPIIDSIVNELGLMSAVVFGRVWRYCQMEDRVCKASLETIGEGIGVDRATVMRHAKVLCDAGYLKDLTPDIRNRPHVYADTGKAGLSVTISGVAQSNTSVAQRNTTVAESKLKIDSKKESKTEEQEGDPKTQNVFSVYESEIGVITPIIADAIEVWLMIVSEKWVKDAIHEAAKNNARNWKYVEAILKRWKAQGNQESMKKNVNGKQSQAAEPIGVSVSRSWLEKKQKELHNG